MFELWYDMTANEDCVMETILQCSYFTVFPNNFLLLYSYVGTKEIDIAATLEYLRDQRPDMVKTKVKSLNISSLFASFRCCRSF